VIDSEEIKRLYREYSLVFQLCDNIRTGLISMSVKEYQELPAYVVPVWRLYNEVYQRLTQKK
jgi:hypothetical protein